MTRKEFVLNIVEELMKNPRAVLAGHGINAAVLQTLIQRPDAMSKLATVLWSTKYAKKGAKGLKKSNNFVIKGYKHFGDFTMKAREDVETFIGGLPGEDAATFNNAEGILTIIMLPDDKTKDTENLAEAIVTGKSYVKDFDSAVRKEFKTPQAMYITVMIGDSAAKPAEVKIAKRKEKINKKKNNKRTPARIKAEMRSKATKKIQIIKRKNSALAEESFNAEMELEQFSELGMEFGATKNTPKAIMSAINKYGKDSAKVKELINNKIAELTPELKDIYKSAVKLAKRGKTSLAKAMLKEIGDDELSEIALVMGGEVLGTDDVLKTRKKNLRAKIKQLTVRNDELLLSLSLSPDNKKNSIRSMISKNNRAIKEARAKLGTYKNISAEGMRNKAAMLKQANATIEENIKKGKTIQEALNDAIAKLDATTAEKQIVKQQVVEQVAKGTPMQFAVQQAIQSSVAIDTPTNTNVLSGNKTIDEIMENL